MLYLDFMKTKAGHEEEFDANGNWVQDNTLIGVLNNLHNPAYEEVSEEKAIQIAKSLDVKLPRKQTVRH